MLWICNRFPSTYLLDSDSELTIGTRLQHVAPFIQFFFVTSLAVAHFGPPFSENRFALDYAIPTSRMARFSALRSAFFPKRFGFP